ncbi:uncharacterized protein LOC134260675 [Saccostrea cucullata]|uniref:uncharacterized protein LOC134260675 n=1 Tax=Saccostrea cuccullata TaxID=36930 RepID=UPI002ED1E6DD
MSDYGARAVVVVNQAGKLRFRVSSVMMNPRTSAQDVMLCDLCKTAVVQVHCDTCLVNLCKACVGEHFSADLSKPHKIIDFKDRKSTLLYPACSFHIKYQCTIITSNIDRYRYLPQRILPSLPKFIPGRIIGGEIGKLFGALSSSSLTSDKQSYSMKTTQKLQETGPPPPVKLLLNEQETVTTIDTDNIYNVVCLNHEEIWTSGRDNTMKLYSINQGSLLRSIKTKSGNIPTNTAVTKNGDLVYTDFYDRTVNVVKNKKIEKAIRLRNWRPLSVCSTSYGDLLVIIESDDNKSTKIICYSGSTEKQIIQFDDEDQDGQFLRYIDCGLSKPWGLCLDTDDNLFVAQKPTFSPRGITTDSQSHILTADNGNYYVHIIDQDGQFIRYIDCGLSVPRGLCTDTNDNLFVAQRGNGQIKKIKYLK